uniref:Uncharacterized protein n=1 Tax=Panagrolaimus sp. JU765 TaxID=591449 RepID=A0AC34QDR3_9BILA
MFANNPQQTIIGGSASYQNEIRRTPYFSTGMTPNQFPSLPGENGAYLPIGPGHPLPPPGSIIQSAQPCPMSPFTKYLDQTQQEALHELILEARRSGAEESDVKRYIDRYLKEILSPEKFVALQQENADFERRLSFFRRGKRSVDSVKGTLPTRFDQATFKTRRQKKAPQKLEFANKGEFLDYIDVPRTPKTLDDLIELV